MSSRPLVVSSAFLLIIALSASALSPRGASGAGQENFTGAETLTDDELIQILKELPNIKQLWLADCRQITDRSIPAIVALPQLDSLALPAGISLEGLKKLEVRKLGGFQIAGAGDDPERFGFWLRMHRDASRLHNDEWGSRGCWWLFKLGDREKADGDNWIKQFVGIPGVRMLALKTAGTTDKGLALLPQVPDLNRLEFDAGSGISDEGVRHIADIKNLALLRITCWHKDATSGDAFDRGKAIASGVKALEGKGLKEFHIGRCLQIEEMLVPYVKSLSVDSRELLVFDGPDDTTPSWPFTLRATEGLVGTPGIKFVSIKGFEGSRWEEGAMKVIWTLPDLEQVTFHNVPVNEAALNGCDKASKLRVLSFLGGHMLTDASCEAIAACGGLKELTIFDASGFTDRGLRAFQRCKSLKALHITGLDGVSQVTDVGLQKALPDCELQIERKK